ncbi:flagellar assembly peptidoglycan hydrolase FlgJ [Stenotrophomonas sp. MMGLT7]|uniref:flagellar assembly peptidoglycan hydrolase FlgJ n=1 Tax=Stenotrophomonas sp. MMGLT7 TaxID=2901227 RepID=UPI001E3ABE97|nr:flagellar assembly peptidoglycan hydrolase FlgJ [Stenotrophomonas sp. MMGLT7]MCD7100252.1 flagellar assembly peptidoglycan hydrolase FlgJ [Stenotrophomonas sp. MMGLT7]
MRIAASPIELNPQTGSDPQKIDQVSRQLEGQFAQMLIKSMRDASFGDSLFPGENQMFREMYDQQIAKAMTEGKGLGLSAVIARQLGKTDAAAQAPADTSTGGTSISGAQAARAYSLVAGRSGGDVLPLQQAAPALDLIAGRDTSSLHASLGRGTAEDWSLDDRWTLPAGEAAGTTDTASSDSVAQAAAQAAAASLGERTPEGFVARIWGHAQQAARELGVDPRALVAQAALETGWGRKGITRGNGSDANNLFGIKATGWSGERVNAGTHEYVGGVKRSERADFRAYGSAAESFSDYVRLLKTSPRYQQALQAGTDVRRFAQGLQRAGYATDPAYAAKIAAIAAGPTIGRAVAAVGDAATGLMRGFASNADPAGPATTRR